MEFDEYQKKSAASDTYEKCKISEMGFIEKILGLPGEAGEVTDKIKKILRDKDGVMSAEDKEAVIKELGDVMWYVAAIARYIDVPLSEVAKKNIAKLQDRLKRGTVHGEGDNR